jgi:hypothetical protein
MRCYFLRGAHICAVELLTDASDEAAINQAKMLFEKRKMEFAAFEVWDRARFVYRHPSLPPKYTVTPDAPAVRNAPPARPPLPHPEAETPTIEKAK